MYSFSSRSWLLVSLYWSPRTTPADEVRISLAMQEDAAVLEWFRDSPRPVGLARRAPGSARTAGSGRISRTATVTCAVGVVAAWMLWALPSGAAAQSTGTVNFNIGKTIVSLDAQYIRQPNELFVPTPFNCVNITNYDGVEWSAHQGEISESGWITFTCTSGDREIKLSLRGTGIFDEIGFAYMFFDMELFFSDEVSTWPTCGLRTVDGPSDPATVNRWEQIDTGVFGICDNWRINANVTMLAGYSLH